MTLPLVAVSRRLAAIEIWLVLGLSLGRSAVYSLLSIVEKLTRPEPLAHQTTTLNNSITPDRPWLDLAYQLAGIVFPLVPALLALYLLRLSGDRDAIGFDRTRFGGDSLRGLALAAAIGIPGLGLYLLARAMGVNTTVQPANLAQNWWTVPVLIGSALMNGMLEEVVVVGFLAVRLQQRGWSIVAVVATSAALRGAYHLYQGFGGFLGNLVMGLVFSWLFWRTKRVTPLVVAHVLMDLVVFLGYALVAPLTDWF